MNLSTLKTRATLVFLSAFVLERALSVIFEGEAPAFALVVGIVWGLALLVLLLAIVADATVGTLKKKEK